MPEAFDMTELGEAAVQLHELYLELKKAGFSRSEAMELLAKVIASGINNSGDDSSAT